MTYPCLALEWNPAHRVIPTRFPSMGLFERVANSEDFEALYSLEALTNDRIRDEVGNISLVPEEDRLFGPGTTPIMAAFTHLNPEGSRFSDGTYGVFYCAHDRDTAIAETRYHTTLFMTATNEEPMRLQMRLYSLKVAGEVVDLRSAVIHEPDIVDPNDYGYARKIGRDLREQGFQGVLYPSVRRSGGECVAAFRARILRECFHAAYLEYNWNGNDIDAIFEVKQIDG